jgi:hypothetical protein
MATKDFVDGSTIYDADWGNDVDRVVYDILQDPANAAAANTALGLGTGSSVTFTGLTLTGNLSVQGNSTLGNASGDTLTIHPNAVTWSNDPTHSGNHTFSGTIAVSSTGISFGSGTDTRIEEAATNKFGFVTDSETALILGAGGASQLPSGVRIGADNSNNLLDDASTGAGTATLYIGNASINVTSDIRLKENVVETQRDALTLIRNLRVVDFTWNDPSDTAENNRNSRGVWTGIIAQESVRHIPWLVNAPDPKCLTCLAGKPCEAHPSNWFMEFQYSFPLVAKAFQQLADRVEELETQAK